MVNVPGRSKGCKTCRTRKIKCSLERPECMQCIKSSRNCLGYQRERVFVHSDVAIEAEKTRAHVRNQPVKRNDSELNSLSPEHWPQVDICSEANVDGLISSSSSMSLVSACLRQQMLASYVGQYQTLSPSAAADARAWMTVVPSIASPTKALETAAYAVALARLGVALDATDMQQESLKLYTQGLHRTQRALWDPRLMYSDETLGACMFLALYEVFQCPGGSRAAYLTHHDGCAKLIQLRGPAAHAEGFAHSIFQGFRFMGTLEALGTKSTFLSNPEWKTVPFSKFPKAPIQRLLDLLLEGPMILKRVDHLHTMPGEKRVPFVVDLLQDCVSLNSKMQEFLLDFEVSEGGPLYWPVPCKQPNVTEVLDRSVDNDELFFISYEFPNVRIGTTMMLSWATLTILLSGVCHLYEYLSQLTTITPTLDGKLTGHFIANGQSQKFEVPPPTRFKEFPIMARNVCQSVKFCLQDELGIPGMIAPLNMIIDAWSSWPGFEKEIAWTKNILFCIQNKGMKMVKYIRDPYE